MIYPYQWYTFCFKAIFVWAQSRPLRVKSQSSKEREKRAYREDGRGWWCYFSLSSCLVFMVFDRAWSLSPLSLPPTPSHSFHLQPMLEVPCALPVTFFSEDLNLVSVSVNKKTPVIFWCQLKLKKIYYNVALWNVMPTNERGDSIGWCWCCILIHTLAREQCDWWQSEELIYGVLWVGNFPPTLMQLNWELQGAAQISAPVNTKLPISSKNHLFVFHYMIWS